MSQIEDTHEWPCFFENQSDKIHGVSKIWSECHILILTAQLPLENKSYFGFTNIGSETLIFRVIAKTNFKFWFGSPWLAAKIWKWDLKLEIRHLYYLFIFLPHHSKNLRENYYTWDYSRKLILQESFSLWGRNCFRWPIRVYFYSDSHCTIWHSAARRIKYWT